MMLMMMLARIFYRFVRELGGLLLDLLSEVLTKTYYLCQWDEMIIIHSSKIAFGCVVFDFLCLFCIWVIRTPICQKLHLSKPLYKTESVCTQWVREHGMHVPVCTKWVGMHVPVRTKWVSMHVPVHTRWVDGLRYACPSKRSKARK